jgi:hypothetical protein
LTKSVESTWAIKEDVRDWNAVVRGANASLEATMMAAVDSASETFIVRCLYLYEVIGWVGNEWIIVLFTSDRGCDGFCFERDREKTDDEGGGQQLLLKIALHLPSAN